MKTIIVIISIVLMVSGIGCVALSEFVTPAIVDKEAVNYAVESGAANEEDYEGYPNLDKASRLVRDVDEGHELVQFDLQQRVAKDNLDYSMHRGVATTNQQVAVEREGMLFGEGGLLSMGLSMAGFGAFTGFLGLMRKRPGDVTTVEMEQALAQAQGKTTEELSAKQKQVIQLVQSVAALMKTFNLDKEAVKHVLNGVQDTDVQVAVSTVKKELGL